MSVPQEALTVLHALALGLAAFAVARGCGRLVVLLRQPAVIGEVAVGLLLAPLLLRVLGEDSFARVVPDDALDWLRVLAQIGLALFLVGLVHELRSAWTGQGTRSAGWVVAGALVPPMATGLLVAAWLWTPQGDGVRGDASPAALALYLAVAFSITAVPVLARILTDRGEEATSEGRLSMTAAIVVDAVGWTLLALALVLHGADTVGAGFAVAALVLGPLASAALRRLLSADAVSGLCRRSPRAAAALVAAAAAAGGLGAEHGGLTLPLGAALVALAIPAGPWLRPVAVVGRAGLAGVPLFFVVSGVSLAESATGTTAWDLIAVAILAAVTGKIGGGYLGARLGGCSPVSALRVGILLNTRGLTEVIVLNIGFTAGIITAPVFAALTVMAVVTTVLTGPLLDAVGRYARRREEHTAGAEQHVPAPPGGRPDLAGVPAPPDRGPGPPGLPGASSTPKDTDEH
ncbi:cation:proton antiporter [Nocardiopsis changdeensis]|uniref:cation:proton antiporter n=1 Tax=Nocardiopsis changdeensis TaxID=2831969 RepID=UPI003F44647F